MPPPCAPGANPRPAVSGLHVGHVLALATLILVGTSAESDSAGKPGGKIFFVGVRGSYGGEKLRSVIHDAELGGCYVFDLQLESFERMESTEIIGGSVVGCGFADGGDPILPPPDAEGEDSYSSQKRAIQIKKGRTYPGAVFVLDTQSLADWVRLELLGDLAEGRGSDPCKAVQKIMFRDRYFAMVNKVFFPGGGADTEGNAFTTTALGRAGKGRLDPWRSRRSLAQWWAEHSSGASPAEESRPAMQGGGEAVQEHGGAEEARPPITVVDIFSESATSQISEAVRQAGVRKDWPDVERLPHPLPMNEVSKERNIEWSEEVVAAILTPKSGSSIGAVCTEGTVQGLPCKFVYQGMMEKCASARDSIVRPEDRLNKNFMEGRPVLDDDWNQMAKVAEAAGKEGNIETLKDGAKAWMENHPLWHVGTMEKDPTWVGEAGSIHHHRGRVVRHYHYARTGKR